MKVLFLDIDGVLNSTKWYMKRQKLKEEGKTFMWRDEAEFDPEAVAHLEKIMVAHPDVEIVISSTWRILHPLAEIRGYIKTAGGELASSKVIDKTPRGKMVDGFEMSSIRGDEIKRWMDLLGDEIKSYVILDDDSDMRPDQKENFVQTNHMNGLTDADAQKPSRFCIDKSQR
jgi:hypothetical protein